MGGFWKYFTSHLLLALIVFMVGYYVAKKFPNLIPFLQ